MTRRGARASRGRARPWPLPLGRCAGRVGSGTRRSGPGRSGGALLLRCRPPCPMGVTGVTSIYRGGERGLVSPPVFKTGAPRRLGGRVRFPSASAIGGVTSTFALRACTKEKAPEAFRGPKYNKSTTLRFSYNSSASPRAVAAWATPSSQSPV